MNKLLNFEYATIQGFYWMVYATVASFASVYLLAEGYSNSEIGIIMAVANVLAVVLQPLAADLADRSRRFSLVSITQIMVCKQLFRNGIIHGQNKDSPAEPYLGRSQEGGEHQDRRQDLQEDL